MKNVVSAYIERWNLVLGLIFILIVSFMPEGLVPGAVRLWRAARQRMKPGRSRKVLAPGSPSVTEPAAGAYSPFKREVEPTP